MKWCRAPWLLPECRHVYTQQACYWNQVSEVAPALKGEGYDINAGQGFQNYSLGAWRTQLEKARKDEAVVAEPVCWAIFVRHHWWRQLIAQNGSWRKYCPHRPSRDLISSFHPDLCLIDAFSWCIKVSIEIICKCSLIHTSSFIICEYCSSVHHLTFWHTIFFSTLIYTVFIYVK